MNDFERRPSARVLLAFVSATLLPSVLNLTAAVAQTATEDEMELAARERLAIARELLASPDASDRRGGVHEVAHQWRRASVTERGRDELGALLRGVVRDPDPGVAAAASRALERDASTDTRTPSPHARTPADEKLAWSATALLEAPMTSARSADGRRLAAALHLVHVASRAASWSAELEAVLEYARRDPDPQIADLVARALELRGGLPLAVRRPSPRSGPAADGEASGQDVAASRLDSFFEATGDPDPEVRLTALHRVLDLIQSEGIGSDARIRGALVALARDSDFRIRDLATKAIEEERR